jgi:nitrite reductase/ring-hydroxylating ferredoxin subunit
VRLLGEDLVAFRDKSGRLGLLHRHCPHRGASLEFGIPAERGIRCCYHGWHFDVDGTILDTPGEPEASRIKTNFCQGAYHLREQHGLIFAYMGAPEDVPELPVYDTFCYPDTTIAPFKITVPCNWLQIVENAADPIHNAFLHAIMSESGEQFGEAFKVLPVLDFPETPIGMLSMATRKVNDTVFIRAGELMLPNVAQFTSGAGKLLKEEVRAHSTSTRWAVPLDDQNSLYIGAGHWDERSAPRSRSLDDYGVDKMPLIGQTAERPYKERQREPGRLRCRRQRRRDRQSQSRAPRHDRPRRGADPPHAGARDQRDARGKGAGDTAAAARREAGSDVRARSDPQAARCGRPHRSPGAGGIRRPRGEGDHRDRGALARRARRESALSIVEILHECCARRGAEKKTAVQA